MATKTVRNASVEGEGIDVRTRQFMPFPPKKNPHTQSLTWGFKLGIFSKAEISKAYANPAASVIYETSMVAVGDCIQGQTISGWSTKRLGEPHVKRGSGTHSASFLSIVAPCGAIVEVSPKEHLDDAEFQKQNPPVQLRLRSVG